METKEIVRIELDNKVIDEKSFEFLMRCTSLKYPILSAFSSMILKQESKEIPTACVSFLGDSEGFTDGIGLFVNMDFMNSLNSNSQKAAIIAHEFTHVLLFHLYTAREIKSEEKEDFDHVRFNIAADIIVNYLIDKTYKIFPKKCIKHTDFFNKNFDPTQFSVKDLYKMLATNSAYNALKNNNKLDEFVKNFDKSLGSHKEWFSEEFSQESIESFSEVHKEMIRQTLEVLDDFTEGNETMRGYISSNIRELIKPKPRTTTINYKAYLTKKIKTFLNKNKRQTYTRLNRRYDDAKGRKKANIDKRVLVAIDTSASMVSETIAELGGVLQHIIQTTGFEVWYTTYSIGVQEPIRVTSKWIEGIGCTERGGTSVDNVFQYLIDTGKIEMFPNIIVLTDGYDVYPTSFNRIPERHKPDVLFYITSNGGSTDYPGVVFRKNDIVKR